MIKATLKYTDCFQDGQRVFRVLIDNNAIIIATKPIDLWFSYPRVVVLFNDSKHMYDTLYALNNQCQFEVALIRYKHLKEKK